MMVKSHQLKNITCMENRSMKKSELRKIIQEEIKKLNESASHSVDIADGEPETGFLPGGHQRKLGINKGKPEP